MVNKRPYRYCIVPLCTNTTITAPEKYYFHVPNDSEVRKKWCHLMKRKEPLSAKTSRHCCEDHFNIESDTENLVKWRLCGGTLKLKQGTVPTKFECQKRNRTATVTRSGYEKRQRIDFINTVLTKEVRPSVAQQDIEFVSCDNPTIDVDNEPANPLPIDSTIALPKFLPTEKNKTKNKGIQVEQQKKDIQTQTIWTYLCKLEQHDDDDDSFEKKLFNVGIRQLMF